MNKALDRFTTQIKGVALQKDLSLLCVISYTKLQQLRTFELISVKIQ